MKQKRCLFLIATVLVVICLLSSIGIITIVAYAQETTIDILGKVYTFGEKEHYDYSASESSEQASTSTANGRFTLAGDLRADGDKNGISSYSVNGDSVSLTYAYSDSLLNADEESWHLVDDNTKTIAGITLDENIKKGALILQTSKDGQVWLNDVKTTNIFADIPMQDSAFYFANSVQLANGCYYRLIIAYETARKVGQNQFLFVKTDEIEYKKTAEVYEFYLHSANQSTNDNTRTKTLGSVVNTGKDNGYSGQIELDFKDPHYGWQLGEFFVSGYTRDTKDDDGTPVFLKNVGDQVTLWFNLKQDIDQLNGNSILSINEDTNGYDQQFQTPKTNMGRGTLIIRYTDENGKSYEPELYTNYLAANATTSADTVVKLFEEGDYEVALDYEIKKTPRKIGSVEVIPEYTNYRISFNFKVRNGNCMVYPFDVITGAELSDEAITPNGFRLDMAKSRYLTIDVTRAVVTSGANGYVEDVRFNRPAKDGDQYTDEGIYTFSVSNLYTNKTTTKKIYVGDTDYMRALSVNKMTVSDLNYQVSLGGKIEDDGTISMPLPLVEPEPIENSSTESEVHAQSDESTTETTEQETISDPPQESDETSEPINLTEEDTDDSSKDVPIVPIAIGSVAVISGTVAFIAKKKKKG